MPLQGAGSAVGPLDGQLPVRNVNGQEYHGSHAFVWGGLRVAAEIAGNRVLYGPGSSYFRVGRMLTLARHASSIALQTRVERLIFS